MSIIQQLPEHIANQIAAGEVVQRPASVVKEMVENAIDAGATKIQVIIKDAGRTLIQIIDNGAGMNAEDAVKCFQRHATSKIKTADDLFQLQTKGFRGEALASIAAISHVTLRTRQEGNHDLGTLLQVEGSQITINESTSCSVGTSFEVKNIFFNVPARRNFLKSDSVEFGHIREDFIRIALAHPDVHFTLHHNNEKIFDLHQAILRKRIVDIAGRSYQEKLVPIDESTDIVRLHGFVGMPDVARKTRGDQYLFVNNRFFKDAYYHNAVVKAFEGLIPDKTYPVYFLFFEVNPAKIDVNIHPTKTEIKFEDDRAIYAILRSAIQQSLGHYNISPTLDFERETAFEIPYDMRKTTPSLDFLKPDLSFNPFEASTFSKKSSGVGNGHSPAMRAQGFGAGSPSSQDWENFYKIEESTPEPEQLTLDIANEKIGQILIRAPYIISNTKSGLLLVHFKRAYERILFDDLLTKFIHSPINSQTLLFPFELNIGARSTELWANNQSLLVQLGFVGEVKTDELHVLAVPSFLEDVAIAESINKLLEVLQQEEIAKIDLAHKLIEKLAKTASKFIQIQNTESANNLLEQLFQCEQHISTPDGKKIMNTLSMNVLDQYF
jgi:DNA mismatch repair protein MutL